MAICCPTRKVDQNWTSYTFAVVGRVATINQCAERGYGIGWTSSAAGTILPLYDDVQRRRHEVRPGMTGWAQVNGRNAISWQEKFAYDVWYVDHLSLSLDIKILLKTLKRCLNAKESIREPM
jgi:hypothetical protein